MGLYNVKNGTSIPTSPWASNRKLDYKPGLVNHVLRYALIHFTKLKKTKDENNIKLRKDYIF